MSAQETTDKRVKDLTEAVSTNLASLFTELIRVSVPQAPPHAPPQEPPNTNINKKVLRKLESMSLQIGSIRSDLRTVKAQTDYERQAAQEKLIEESNLIDLLDLSDTEEISEPAPVEKYNELARAHNRELAHVHDLIAPLHNPRGNPVFGFPATVGDLISLHPTAEKFLCAAFGLKYEESSDTFVKFCGFDPVYLEELGEEYSDYIGIASKRVENFYKRQTDIETTGKPTVSTRKAAADHNVEARRYNARAGSDWDLIKPIHDGRNLAVPGFPSLYGWFMTPHKKDVLYLLGEYGLSTEPEGCMQRFEDFVGVPKSEDRDKGVEWYL